MDTNRMVGSLPAPMLISNEKNRLSENLEKRSTGMETEGLSIHDRDLESLMNSPVGSSLGRNDSRKHFPESSSSSSCGYCSGSVSEEEEVDGCLDDWEAVADALTLDDEHRRLVSAPSGQLETIITPANLQQSNQNSSMGLLKTENGGMDTGPQPACRAWRPDDAFRPRSLPNLSKQHCFSMNSDWHGGHGTIPWAWQSIVSQPSSCPICYEDLDLTDSRFFPCSCGFRLCLFCHKKILEADGRCPGCRKQYDATNCDIGSNGGVPPFQMTHSCSMSTRS
ncbi:uncharacterized protein LOC131168364 isoform X2 [Malania oleifera]|nr:uncharacterized protein LOC131168364 isoform X2 [Malania oleifera]